MYKNDFIRLRHILDAAQEAVDFVQDKTKQDLCKNRMLALALIKSVEIMGEAAANVTRETQQLLPQIPWQHMIKTRNRLIHGYFDINFEVVWDTVTEDIPPLIKNLEEVINKNILDKNNKCQNRK